MDFEKDLALARAYDREMAKIAAAKASTVTTPKTKANTTTPTVPTTKNTVAAQKPMKFGLAADSGYSDAKKTAQQKSSLSSALGALKSDTATSKTQTKAAQSGLQKQLEAEKKKADAEKQKKERDAKRATQLLRNAYENNTKFTASDSDSGKEIAEAIFGVKTDRKLLNNEETSGVNTAKQWYAQVAPYLEARERATLQKLIDAGDFKGVERYYNTISADLNKRYTDAVVALTEKNAAKKNNTSTGLAVDSGLSTGEGSGFLDVLGESTLVGAENAVAGIPAYISRVIDWAVTDLTGKQRDTDVNSRNYLYARVANAEERGLSRKIDAYVSPDQQPKLNYLAHMASNAWSSAVTNMLQVFMTGGTGALAEEGTLLGMSLSASGKAFVNNLDDGQDQDRALANATVAGVIEYLTERVPVHMYLDSVSKIASKSMTRAGFVKDLLARSAAEGVEEVVGNIAENTWDIFYNKENSDYRKLVNDYVKSGMSEDSAEAEALERIFFWQGLEAFVTAAISSVFMSGPQAVSVVQGNKYYSARGAAIRERAGADLGAAVDTTINTAKAFGKTNKATGETNEAYRLAESAEKKISKGKSLSDYELGALTEAVEDEIAASNRAKITRVNTKMDDEFFGKVDKLATRYVDGGMSLAQTKLFSTTFNRLLAGDTTKTSDATLSMILNNPVTAQAYREYTGRELHRDSPAVARRELMQLAESADAYQEQLRLDQLATEAETAAEEAAKQAQVEQMMAQAETTLPQAEETQNMAPEGAGLTEANGEAILGLTREEFAAVRRSAQDGAEMTDEEINTLYDQLVREASNAVYSEGLQGADGQRTGREVGGMEQAAGEAAPGMDSAAGAGTETADRSSVRRGVAGDQRSSVNGYRTTQKPLVKNARPVNVLDEGDYGKIPGVAETVDKYVARGFDVIPVIGGIDIGISGVVADGAHARNTKTIYAQADADTEFKFLVDHEYFHTRLEDERTKQQFKQFVQWLKGTKVNELLKLVYDSTSGPYTAVLGDYDANVDDYYEELGCDLFSDYRRESGISGELFDTLRKILGQYTPITDEEIAAERYDQETTTDDLGLGRFKFSVSETTAPTDAEYIRLAQNPEANKDRLQEMVDEAAKRAGYLTTGYHGTIEKFTVFDAKKSNHANAFGRGIYLTNDEANARGYAGMNGLWNADLSNNVDGYAQDAADSKFDRRDEYPDWVDAYNSAWDEKSQQIAKDGHVLRLYVKLNKPFIVAEDNMIDFETAKSIIEAMDTDAYFRREFLYDLTRMADSEGKVSAYDFSNGNYSLHLPQALKALGYDGIIDETVNLKFRLFKGTTHIVVFDAINVKSADPVTYDDMGNVIPLSVRFDSENPDIRFSVSKTAASDNERLIRAAREGRLASELDRMMKEAQIDTEDVVVKRAAAKIARNVEREYGREAADTLLSRIEEQQASIKRAAELANPSIGAADAGFDPYTAAQNRYGTIEPGEEPARTVDVPRSTNGSDRVSDTVRTVMEAEATPEGRLDTIADAVVGGKLSEQPNVNKVTLRTAERRVEKLKFRNALNEWNKRVSSGETSDFLVAMGAVLLNNAGNSDMNGAEYADILIDYTDLLRRSARAVQAARILKTLTPNAKLYEMQKIVDKLNEEYQEKLNAINKNTDKLGIELNKDLVDRFLNAKTDEERDAIIDEIKRDIASQIPTTLSDRIAAWRYMNMLGNFKTQVRNVVGNTAMQAVRINKDIVKTAIEGFATHVLKSDIQRTTTFVANPELRKQCARDSEAVMDLIMNGPKFTDEKAITYDIEQYRTIFGNTRSKAWNATAGKIFESYRRITNTAMNKGDIIFNKFAYADAMAKYMTANKITFDSATPAQIDAARNYAIKQAAESTFHDKNSLSDAVAKIGFRNPKNGVEKGANILVGGILPFKRTPANILVRAIEYSPVGILTSIGTEVVDSSKDPNRFIENISKAITGTGFSVLGFMLASGIIGNMRLRGKDDDEEDKANFDDLLGHQEYSIEFADGTNITLDWLAPFSVPLFLGAQVAQVALDDGLTIASALEVLSAISDPVLEMSMLQGVNEAFKNAATYGNDSALVRLITGCVWSYATQMTTNTLVGQFKRSLTNDRMTTYTDKNNKNVPTELQYMLGKMSAKVPVWDYNQIPYIDAWGEIEQNAETKAGNAINQFFNPAYTSKVKTDKLTAELERLYDVTGEMSVLPERGKSYFNIDKKRVDLTAEEYVTYQTARGRTAKVVLNDLFKSTAYQRLSNADKAAAVSAVYTYAEEYARVTTKPEYQTTQKWTTEAYDDFANYAIPIATYITAKNATGNAKGEKDARGDTIENSASMKKAYIIKNLGLSEEQEAKLMEDFDVGKTVRKWNTALIERRLERMGVDITTLR